MFDISDTLKGEKICNLSDFSFKHGVDLQFLVSFFNNPEYNSLIDEAFEFNKRTNQLISKKYIETLSRKFRGLLNGSTVPL